MIMVTVPAIAQKNISGKVSDTEGKPVPGVNVTIKGTVRGTVTDHDGHYMIDNINTSQVLLFSHTGFEVAEKAIKNESVINVALKAAGGDLDEVVIIGYDAVKKKDLTGAVGSVNPKELTDAPTANFDQALAGRIAGVDVTSNDGTPGDDLNIVIRGGNSITGSNAPLFVVDGIPLPDFNVSSINTRDIKSFDILKDASATAIYGSRGANGVILITTISGRTDGKTDINFTTSGWLQTIPNRLDVMTPYEYVKYQQAVAYANDSYVPGVNVNQFIASWIDPELYKNVAGTNWQDEIFQTALANNHTISLRTGNKNTTLLYSGNYLNQQGTVITSSFRKINNRIKFTHKIAPNLEVNGQADYSHLNYDGLQVAGLTRASVIRDAVSFRPVQPLKPIDDEESLLAANDPYLVNPVISLRQTEQTRTDDILSGALGLNYKFLRKFDLSLMGNYRTNIRENTMFYKQGTYDAERTDRGINGSISTNRNNILSTSNTLRFKDQKDEHAYTALVGLEAQVNTSKSSTLRNTNLPTDEFGIHNLGIATTPTIAGSFASKNTLLSYFGRLNYAYGNRYLATINFRTDGSSKFRNENRWGYFPSFSLAWKLSEEKFLQQADMITDLKLRGGWGLTGNNGIGDFSAFNLYAISTSSGYILGENQGYSPGAYQSNMAVPDLRWETTAQTNIGLDLEILKRFNVTADVYQKNTKDLLLNADMALSTGFGAVQQNIGEVSNRGLELTFDGQLVRKKDFTWISRINVSFNRTKTIHLNTGQSRILTDPQWDLQFTQTEYQYITQVGQPVGMIYGLQFDGIYQVDDFTQSGTSYQLREGIPSYQTNMRPGMVRFKDLNGDGIINSDDRTVIGNPNPKHIGGFFNTFRYKAFDLQFLFQWASDFDILNGNKAEFGSIYNAGRNGLKSLTDIWTPTNTDTDIEGMRYDDINLIRPYGYRIDSRHVDDGSYIKLKTLVLGYSLPAHLLRKLHLKNCRITLSAQNLHTWTRYTGYDPDVSVGRFGALTPRLDYSAYPQSRTISGGIDITF
ncbi:TonB-dependent receptor [Niabella yanshanensis]|uniref:TonB-dependent receptor n=2 Tax=Niabella yanshanensis TaxID=577386 RepID=A0ABZ0W6E7_9BACT|nr:TonB-dependent receptor [Niabella yanshanensis]